MRGSGSPEHGLSALLGFLHALAERDLHERIEARGGFVEQQQVGPRRKRRDQRPFWRLPFESALILFRVSSWKRSTRMPR